MLYRAKFAVCSEIRTEQATNCGQNVDFLTLNLVTCKITVSLGKINGKACRSYVVYIAEIRGSNLDPETGFRNWRSRSFRRSKTCLFRNIISYYSATG
jgi:hypothetical protein